MKLSYNWLTDYVDLAGMPAEEVADTLTMLGLEVDGIERIGSSFDGVVVGHVLEAKPHPNADRLKLCSVDLGDGAPVQVVCGGPNVAAGQRVPVAQVGTTLMLPSRKSPGELEPVTLTKAKIRGEASNGMICSESELGLSDDHSGIMVLDEDAPLGQPIDQYLKHRGQHNSDVVFHVAITPNRPDATSHVGVARDLAAALGKPLSMPSVDQRPAGTSPTVSVTIEDEDACPRYVGLVVRGVTVAPSPEWLQDRLRAVGLRPINNVVDVTNFVMYEVGQPLHAFDLAKLAGSGDHQAAIVVRSTSGEQSFTTLDDQKRTLPPNTLLISDAQRPVAVAGVMGGLDSEVTDQTTDVLIESAYFEPSGIRKTARALSLQTDSSYRFERGADPQIQAWAANRAADLLVELAGGTAEANVVDAFPSPPSPLQLELRPQRVGALLGVDIAADEIDRLLTAIGFEVTRPGESLSVVVPSFRPDVEREVDLIEEVARLHGYDNIPLPGRMTLPSVAPRLDARRAARAEAANRLAGMGLRELYGNTLLPEEVASRYAVPPFADSEADAVVTANAINRDMAALRPSLLPGVLNIIAHNLNRGASSLRLFEFGHVFSKDASATDEPVQGYRERESLIISMTGDASSAGWAEQHRSLDFFDLKGIVSQLFEALGVPDLSETVRQASGVLSYGLDVSIDGTTVGTLGRVADETARYHDIEAEVFFAEIDWTATAELVAERSARRYTPIPRFPESERDIALVVDENVSAGHVLETIRETGGYLLRSARIFDVYRGDRLPAGKKSIAFGLRFGGDRTLKDKEVDRQVQRIVAVVEADYAATLRS